MKRIFLLLTAIAAACAITPAASADPIATDLVGGGSGTDSVGEGVPASSMSTLNPILNRIPLLSGPDRRHICLISDQVDKSWCVYVAIP